MQADHKEAGAVGGLGTFSSGKGSISDGELMAVGHLCERVTQQDELLVRPAEPTIADGLLYARLLEQAQEGLFRILLGRPVIEIIANAYIEPRHELSWEFALFAELDGQVVGMGTGYSSSQHATFTNEPLIAAAGRRRHRLAFAASLNRRALQFMDTHRDGDFYLRALAVDPELRGRGIGSRLIEELETRARTSGSVRFTLDVAAKNHDGRRLYERMGFALESESPRWFGLPNTNVLRMTKPL